MENHKVGMTSLVDDDFDQLWDDSQGCGGEKSIEISSVSLLLRS